MSKEETKELLQFLKPFDKDVIDLVMWLRDFAWDACPEANELIYDNYNAVAFGWSVTDKLGHTICSIAVFRTNQNVHFGFLNGKELSDKDKILLGQGNQYRYVLVKNKKTFPKKSIKTLINESYTFALSKAKNEKQSLQGRTIVKSVSDKKREKNPAKAKGNTR